MHQSARNRLARGILRAKDEIERRVEQASSHIPLDRLPSSPLAEHEPAPPGIRVPRPGETRLMIVRFPSDACDRAAPR